MISATINKDGALSIKETPMTLSDRYRPGDKARVIGCGISFDQKWCRSCTMPNCRNRLSVVIVNGVTSGIYPRVEITSPGGRSNYKYPQNMEPFVSKRFLEHKAALCKE